MAQSHARHHIDPEVCGWFQQTEDHSQLSAAYHSQVPDRLVSPSAPVDVDLLQPAVRR